jgi:hypothetical protein
MYTTRCKNKNTITMSSITSLRVLECYCTLLQVRMNQSQTVSERAVLNLWNSLYTDHLSHTDTHRNLNNFCTSVLLHTHTHTTLVACVCVWAALGKCHKENNRAETTSRWLEPSERTVSVRQARMSTPPPKATVTFPQSSRFSQIIFYLVTVKHISKSFFVLLCK